MRRNRENLEARRRWLTHMRHRQETWRRLAERKHPRTEFGYLAERLQLR